MAMHAASIALPYAERFPAVAARLPGSDLPWLRELRENSFARFARLGLPSPRVEQWKYTNLNPLAKAELAPALEGAAAAVGPLRLDGAVPAELAGAHRLVFVDGRFRRDLSRTGALPAGVSLGGLAEALADGEAGPIEPLLIGGAGGEARADAILALNTALMADGCVLRLGPGVVLAEPVHLLFVGGAGGTGLAYHPRNLILAERGSRAVVFESHLVAAEAGGGVYWSNPVTQVVVGDGAALEHYRFQDEGAEAFHIALTEARVAAGGRYDSFVLGSGGRLARQEIRVRLDGPGASCRLLGGYLARGRQHIDNTTEIVHAKPQTTSREVYKGVLDDQGRAVFQGRILVEKAAQKADGHQLNRTLLLSDRAEIDTKPELEIYADDVKCSHGATAGELDEGALFYLRARGIDERAARRMLIEAFLGELGEELANPAARILLQRQVAAWLGSL